MNKFKKIFQKRRKKRSNLSKALIISILLHFVFIMTRWDLFIPTNEEDSQKVKKKRVDIGIIDSKSEFIKKIKNKIKNGIKIKRKLQIVNNESTSKDSIPKDHKFLGEKNQVFNKQTVTKSIGSFKRAGKGEKESLNDRMNSDNKKSIVNKGKPVNKSSKSEITQVENKNLKNLTNKFLKKRDLSLSDLVLENLDDKAINNFEINSKKNNERFQNKGIQQGIKNGDENSLGLSMNNDFIEDVPLGDMTNLNTVQFKYFGFYSRIRKQLEQYWGYSLKEKAEKLFRTGRILSPNENFVTSLQIIIDNSGNVIKVVIIGSSGNKDLDDAAVESFNKAGPFPNPPKGMLEEGIATIEWGFVVKS